MATHIRAKINAALDEEERAYPYKKTKISVEREHDAKDAALQQEQNHDNMVEVCARMFAQELRRFGLHGDVIPIIAGYYPEGELSIEIRARQNPAYVCEPYELWRFDRFADEIHLWHVNQQAKRANQGEQKKHGDDILVIAHAGAGRLSIFPYGNSSQPVEVDVGMSFEAIATGKDLVVLSEDHRLYRVSNTQQLLVDMLRTEDQDGQETMLRKEGKKVMKAKLEPITTPCPEKDVRAVHMDSLGNLYYVRQENSGYEFDTVLYKNHKVMVEFKTRSDRPDFSEAGKRVRVTDMTVDSSGKVCLQDHSQGVVLRMDLDGKNFERINVLNENDPCPRYRMCSDGHIVKHGAVASGSGDKEVYERSIVTLRLDNVKESPTQVRARLFFPNSAAVKSGILYALVGRALLCYE
jgi:hypothetical protein